MSYIGTNHLTRGRYMLLSEKFCSKIFVFVWLLCGQMLVCSENSPRTLLKERCRQRNIEIPTLQVIESRENEMSEDGHALGQSFFLNRKDHCPTDNDQEEISPMVRERSSVADQEEIWAERRAFIMSFALVASCIALQSYVRTMMYGPEK